MGPPDTPHQFIDRDLHPATTLWDNERLISIIDWVTALRGPARHRPDSDAPESDGLMALVVGLGVGAVRLWRTRGYRLRPRWRLVRRRLRRLRSILAGGSDWLMLVGLALVVLSVRWVATLLETWQGRLQLAVLWGPSQWPVRAGGSEPCRVRHRVRFPVERGVGIHRPGRRYTVSYPWGWDAGGTGEGIAMSPRTDLLRLVDTWDLLDEHHRGSLLWLAELLLDWQRAYGSASDHDRCGE